MEEKRKEKDDQKEYLEIGKEYSSRDYKIVTAQRGDHQTFMILRR